MTAPPALGRLSWLPSRRESIMRAFACGVCRSLVFFDNDRCVTCGSWLAYDRVAGRPRGRARGRATPLRQPQDRELQLARRRPGADGLCGCCALTRTRPADADLPRWRRSPRTEAAKRRLVYQLDHLGLPTTPRRRPENGLAFDLLSSAQRTGHHRPRDGVITIDLAEGDDPHREALRVQLAEPYRTLLGHLRHEIGHWYWTVLVEGTPAPRRFRDLLGDERADYAEALERALRQAGGQRLDRHLRQPLRGRRTRGRTGPRPSPTTCTSATRWRRRRRGACTSPGPIWISRWPGTRTLEVDPAEQAESFDELARSWIAFEYPHQRDQPQHGQGRPLPVPAGTGRARQTALRARRGDRA